MVKLRIILACWLDELSRWIMKPILDEESLQAFDWSKDENAFVVNTDVQPEPVEIGLPVRKQGIVWTDRLSAQYWRRYREEKYGAPGMETLRFRHADPMRRVLIGTDEAERLRRIAQR